MGYPKKLQTLALSGDSIMKTKIFLTGPFLTRSGYGEQARFALRSLRSREDVFDIYMQPLSWGNTSWVAENDEERQWIDRSVEKTIGYIQQGGQFDASIQVTIPNEWKPIAPINIGYTAGIETTKCSFEWLQKVNEMDQVIVVSNHSKDVFDNTVYEAQDPSGNKTEIRTLTGISVVNYPVKTFIDSEGIDLNLPTKFNFLSVAQFGPRKNLPKMISWFMEEFADEPEVGLVLKTNQAKNCLMDREHCEGVLRSITNRYPESQCKVYMIHGDMTDQEMHALYEHSDMSAYVAIPHGEGFGLPIFEAAYTGMPVVATGWSGQMDFLVDEQGNEKFYNVSFDISQVQPEVEWKGVIIKESGWAYAREESFKQNLRQCYNDTNDNTGTAAAATAYANELKERFSQEKMYAEFVNALGLEVDSDWAEQLSNIEII